MSATYTLVVQPDGRAILTSPRPLTPEQEAWLAEGFARWRAKEGGVLVLPDCDVVQVLTLDLDDGVPRAPGGVYVPFEEADRGTTD